MTQIKPEVKRSKRYKTALSVLSIVVLVSIIVLLPKPNKKAQTYEPPRTSTRYIPAPTPKPTGIEVNTEIPNVILPKDLQD